MKSKFQDLRRHQLDMKINVLSSLLQTSPPAKGWVQAIRQGLGMTRKELAQRLKMSEPGVFAMERSEANKKITLGTLAKAANALNGELVYAIIPRQSLEKSVRDQARRLADELINRVSSSMELEAQGLKKQENNAQAEALAEELLAKRPPGFWK